ncbi:hypothetical protein NQZ79_g5812 [Umbelopsis isabellina]|nr:hypothetical protein NQZ79_g5812 [Umbelopsis isabellina]
MSNPNNKSHPNNNNEQTPKHNPMERVIPRPQPLHNPHLSRHHRAISRTPSMSVANDQAFIEFSRCLYQAKTIVKELQAFSANVSPSLRMSMLRQNNLTDGQDNQKETAEQFLDSIRHYLQTTFEKFARLCKVLMFVLSKMEASGSVRIERITSFRRDVTDAWRVANDIKDRLSALIAQESMFLNYGDTATPASMSSSTPYNPPRSAPSPCESQTTEKMPNAYSQASPSIASSPASSPYNLF